MQTAQRSLLAEHDSQLDNNVQPQAPRIGCTLADVELGPYLQRLFTELAAAAGYRGVMPVTLDGLQAACRELAREPARRKRLRRGRRVVRS